VLLGLNTITLAI